ncbi:hypothetical protein [Campylobacter jejuni]|nr:hypothetical protein [Campylobacter jejuni]
MQLKKAMKRYESSCVSVHWVSEELDGGMIIAQKLLKKEI